MIVTNPKLDFVIKCVVMFFVAAAIFGAVVYRNIVTDIQDHAGFIIQILAGELIPPPNFLYYLTVYSLAFFSSNFQTLLIVSVLVLAVAVTAKFAVTYQIFRLYYKDSLLPQPRDRFGWLVTIFALSLPFTFSLLTPAAVNGRWYLGQIPPNVWHNSTTIFLMPFALGLFWVSYQNLVIPSLRRNIVILLLVIANILVKPSFFFVFMLVYPLMLLGQAGGLRRSFWPNLIPVAVGVIFLAAEYYLIYLIGAGNVHTESGGVKFGPFSVWAHYSPNIALSILVSTLFPVVYLAFYWRELLKNLLLRYAVVLFVVGVLIMALLSETGPREFHGNFFWQAYVTNYIQFVAVAVLFVGKLINSKMLGARFLLILGAFGLQVFAGLAYLTRFFFTGSYF
ncbi:MAG: hypothetical protein FOGNACKC_04128 [Anaerolineae bacterium]|nr:hypothetical protein [Anaerolineae bacterium]